jgi:uncharacterized protein YqgC (DUF456 family)
MLLGLAGALLPALPGLPIIWAAYLGYGWYTGWVGYGAATMIVTGLVVAISLVVDQLASATGASKFGASRAGMIGSVLGSIAGFIFFNLIGLVLGVFLGAMICELAVEKRDFREALNSGAGALLGFLAGSLFKFMLGLALLGYFIFAVAF